MSGSPGKRVRKRHDYDVLYEAYVRGGHVWESSLRQPILTPNRSRPKPGFRVQKSLGLARADDEPAARPKHLDLRPRSKSVDPARRRGREESARKHETAKARESWENRDHRYKSEVRWRA
jgi:hypothetical protein